MANTTGRLIDRNRYSKTYPYTRRPSRFTMMSDRIITIELGKLTFTNSSSEILVYDKPFDNSDYNIVATARDENVNVFVDPNGTGENQVKIGTSAPFTGTVDVMAIYIQPEE
jgi:hypothetical protein